MLNVTGYSEFQLASRITLLPLTLRNLTSRSLNFASLTPGTSFNLRSNMGLSDERIVLYWLLRHAWGEATMRGVEPLKILRGGSGIERFGPRVKAFDRTSLDPGLTAKFKTAPVAHDRKLRSRGEATLKQRFRDLSDHFRYRKHVARVDNQDPSSSANCAACSAVPALMATATVTARFLAPRTRRCEPNSAAANRNSFTPWIPAHE